MNKENLNELLLHTDNFNGLYSFYSEDYQVLLQLYVEILNSDIWIELPLGVGFPGSYLIKFAIEGNPKSGFVTEKPSHNRTSLRESSVNLIQLISKE